MISIRLSRGGRTHYPIYTIVAADSRRPRDGRFLEKLGQYNPNNAGDKVLSNINTERIAHWVGNGAQLTSTVKTLLKKNNISL